MNNDYHIPPPDSLPDAENYVGEIGRPDTKDTVIPEKDSGAERKDLKRCARTILHWVLALATIICLTMCLMSR